MSERDRGEGEQLSVQAWRRAVGEWLCEKASGETEPAGTPAGGCVRADTKPRLLAKLSNEEILVDLKSFVGAERRSLARLIVYLVEIEERRLHLELACSSMFDFCTRRLGFSEGEAFRRLTAARLVRRLPVLLDAIAPGRIHLSSLVLLPDLLTEANVDEVVAAASGKTRREVEELVARMAPKPDVMPSIRRLPERSASGRHGASRTSSPLPQTTPPSLQLKPIAESRYRVQLTANESLRDKLELARTLMSHRNPSGDLAVIVEQAVDLLIEKLSKEKLGTASRARRSKPSAKRGHVTRAARREAFERDGMQCSFVGENGERCPARCFLEIDHVTPRALGGSAEAENLRILCRAHNRDAAERVFGRAHVEARTRERRREASIRPNHGLVETHRFRQRKFVEAKTPAGEAALVDASHDVRSPMSDHEARSQVRGALLALGFRIGEAERAVTTIDTDGGDESWRRPIETILREALGVLT
ncbi:hypothetical protein AKJ09_02238 [Labilithrix luteola]|uniref:HNH nuclease domain-containing protein n=1 Tax=Labilithrix luteola TaxID=1391654 RepID=A0A0K1PR31_9BACT|nr:hypothetical protein [Labilithrix luteola]AKU95574.1 hypothetical protein AKJ09_02238 [Labilithrix luteola]